MIIQHQADVNWTYESQGAIRWQVSQTKPSLTINTIWCLPPMFAFVLYKVSINTVIIITFFSAIAFLSIDHLSIILHNEWVFLLLFSQKHSSAWNMQNTLLILISHPNTIQFNDVTFITPLNGYKEFGTHRWQSKWMTSEILCKNLCKYRNDTWLETQLQNKTYWYGAMKSRNNQYKWFARS